MHKNPTYGPTLSSIRLATKLRDGKIGKARREQYKMHARTVQQVGRMGTDPRLEAMKAQFKQTVVMYEEHIHPKGSVIIGDGGKAPVAGGNPAAKPAVGGFLLQGVSGMGKTAALKELMEELETDGYKLGTVPLGGEHTDPAKPPAGVWILPET